MKQQAGFSRVFVPIFGLLCLAISAFGGRPPFDKTSHQKTVWIHANSWFAANKDRLVTVLGGPDQAFKWYVGKGVWEETARVLSKYGVNGIQYEIGIWNPQRVQGFSKILDEFVSSGTSMEGVFFIPIHMPKFHENMMTFIGLSKPEFDHPRYHKIDGRPVIVLYRTWAQKPEAIAAMISDVEAKYGRFIWLAEMMMQDNEGIRKYVPIVDGITMYGNWTMTNQQEYFSRLVPIMHQEFPEKIFEAGVQNLNCDHFHMGGVVPTNLDKFFASWKTALEAKPDSICLTNMFDHSENSHMLPSWAWEDVLMRVNQYNIRNWRGEAPCKTPANIRPEFFVVNPAFTIIGRKATFDLITFPAGAAVADTVDFAIVNAQGKVLKSFGKVTMATNKLDFRRFEVDTAEFANEKALFPKIRWQVFPKGTVLVPGFKPWMLYYASCTENALKLQSTPKKVIPDGSWRMDDAVPGDTLVYPEDGRVCVSGCATPMYGKAYNHNKNNRARLLRNGEELLAFPYGTLNFTNFFNLPNPGSAVDTYNLELENEDGYRYITMPIYVSARKRQGKVAINIPDDSMAVKAYQVEAERVPFFYYPCLHNDLRQLRDVSGYTHDGFIAGVSFQGGHLPMTGYRHEHFGPVSIDQAADPVFQKDADDAGYYHFGGKGYIKIMGCGMPPYASTVEFSVRVADYQNAGVFGTGNCQLNIQLLADGRIQALRSQRGISGNVPGKSVVLTSKAPISKNSWTKVAVVYDAVNVSLYVNGVLQESAPFAPVASHEMFNAVVLGATGSFPFADAVSPFTGDLKQIRIYARNLAPAEFL